MHDQCKFFYINIQPELIIWITLNIYIKIDKNIINNKLWVDDNIKAWFKDNFLLFYCLILVKKKLFISLD